MKRNSLVLALLAGIALAAVATAAPKLPNIFSDHMVLQRDRAIPVWGTAEAGEEVSVSFAGQTKTTKADADGKWMVHLDAMPAQAEGAELNVTGKTERVFKNVVVGEVWICSGQSNMEWSVNGSKNPEKEKAAANLPLIRHIKVPKRPSDRYETDFNSRWQVCSPDTVGSFTAVGFYFARELRAKVNVPIGLINSSWGGTKIEPWMPRAGFGLIQEQGFAGNIIKRMEDQDPSTVAGKQKYRNGFANLKKWIAQAEQDVDRGQVPTGMPQLPMLNRSHQDPTRLYKGMIHPLVPYAMRGAIWYQGESNGGEGESYTHKMDGLVNGWRTVWDQGDFPFYFVQLANFQKDSDTPQGGNGFSRIRWAQQQALRIKNTGMAVIIDIGEENDIHPRNKQDVGKRLAQWALKHDYGMDVVPSGPLYKSHAVEDGKIRVQFDHIGKGLMVGSKNELDPVVEDKGKLKRFAIQSKDGKWHWAQAKIEGDSVVVWNDAVKEPVHVRYAYDANPVGANLYNRDDLPAGPFRSDP